MTPRLLLVLLNLTYSTIFGQIVPNRDRQVVLLHDNIGTKYVFDHSKLGGYDRTELTYLGKLKTKDGRVFKVLTSTWYWGLVPRGTSRIVVFNGNNHYLGSYYVAKTYELPNKIEKNALVFENKAREECDTSIVTRINFTYGLPKRLFLKCKNKLGDIYNFGSE